MAKEYWHLKPKTAAEKAWRVDVYISPKLRKYFKVVEAGPERIDFCTTWFCQMWAAAEPHLFTVKRVAPPPNYGCLEEERLKIGFPQFFEMYGIKFQVHFEINVLFRGKKGPRWVMQEVRQEEGHT